MRWRAGAILFREIPASSGPCAGGRFSRLVRDLIDFFQSCGMDGTDVRRCHPEIEKALDDHGVNEG
jgi:hypothetical protein